jgi:hypothetical protein
MDKEPAVIPPLPDHMVAITKKELARLKDRENFLEALQAAGVDNWQGYSEAYRFYKTGEWDS